MYKIKYLMVVIILFLITTGCNVKEKNIDVKNNTYKIFNVELNEDGDIIIDKSNITDEVSYYNYEYEGTIISLLAVKDENNIIHIVINTCQSCGGSPNAYFIQKDNNLQCKNCGNTFPIVDLSNLIDDGCNPIRIKNIQEKDNKYIIQHEELETYQDKFINWNGPK